jgi:hypothetical protein
VQEAATILLITGAKSVDSYLVECILQPKSGMKWVGMDI